METKNELLEKLEQARQKRRENLPDESACLNVMLQACGRLRELGWQNIIYCPKDGSVFLAIEFGSTGIHYCHYEGDWPNGGWWVQDGGDLWLSHPIMWKSLNDPPTRP